MVQSNFTMWASLLIVLTLHGIFVLGHMGTASQNRDEDWRTCDAPTDTNCREKENSLKEPFEEDMDIEAKISDSIEVLPTDDIYSGIVPVTETETRLVLVGRTGEGKSSTANSILGRQHFKAKVTAMSVTEHCAHVRENVHGTVLSIVDTPGLFDTTKPSNETLIEISKSLMLSAPGAHAFLLVLSTQRFTREIESTVELLRNAFGEDILNYTVIVFTRREDLDHTKISIKDFLKEIPNYMEKLLNSCGWRYVAFNNWLKGEENAQQVEELLKIVNDLTKSNGGKFYSSKQYRKVEEYIQADEKRKKEEIEKQRQENIAPYLETLKKTEVENAELLKQNAERKKNIQKLKADQEEDKKKIKDQKQRQEKANAREKELKRLAEEQRQTIERMEENIRTREKELKKIERENRRARENMKNVRGNTRKRTLAFTGASVGASFGLIFGPVGAAVGAAVGGIIGHIVDELLG